MSSPKKYFRTDKRIFSPGSAYGRILYARPDGKIADLYGQEVARASLSARRVKALGLLTSGTCGRAGSISSQSASLQSFLGSRLREKTASLGSTLYKLTWKVWTTPAGRSLPLLRASARRTSESANTGWPTPQCADVNHARGTPEYAARTMRRKHPPTSLAIAVHKVGWATPKASDGSGGRTTETKGGGNVHLDKQARLSGWPTPMAGTPAQNGNNEAGNNDSSRRTTAYALNAPARLTASGKLLTGSDAQMKSGGRLNPEHSRWQMGLSPAWGNCAPTETPSSRRRRKRL